MSTVMKRFAGVVVAAVALVLGAPPAGAQSKGNGNSSTPPAGSKNSGSPPAGNSSSGAFTAGMHVTEEPHVEVIFETSRTLEDNVNSITMFKKEFIVYRGDSFSGIAYNAAAQQELIQLGFATKAQLDKLRGDAVLIHGLMEVYVDSELLGADDRRTAVAEFVDRASKLQYRRDWNLAFEIYHDVLARAGGFKGARDVLGGSMRGILGV
jgi:hypothetical protein